MAKKYFPPMHTAEHILNRTMVNMFGCERSVNSHIERKKSKCDYYLDRKPTQEEIKNIEQKVNEIIQQDLEIWEEYLDYDQAAKKYKLRVSKEQNPKIRIVHIGEYDDCPCIGDHVQHTAQIGEFKIISTSYENGSFRIRFKVFPKNWSEE